MAKKSKPNIPKGYSASGDKTIKLITEEYFYRDLAPVKKSSKAKTVKQTPMEVKVVNLKALKGKK